MASYLQGMRRKALFTVALIAVLTFLLTLTGSPYRVLSRFLFRDGSDGFNKAGPTVFRYGNDAVTIKRGHHQLYADRVDYLSDASVSIIYRSNHQQITANCSSSMLLGIKRGSSWRLCTVGPFRPEPPCFALSFDSNAQWRFQATSIAVNFGCQVLLFDHHNWPKPKKRLLEQNHGSVYEVTHIKQGLHSPKALGLWATDTYLGHLKRLHAESAFIDVLEVSIDDTEWLAIETAITDESVLNVKQLLLAAPVSPKPTIQQMRDEIRVIARLEEAGFRLWHHSLSEMRNRNGNFCRQFHYINQRFVAMGDGKARNSKSSAKKLQDSVLRLSRSG